MVLSDTDIMAAVSSGDLSIDPYDHTNVEPASVDLRLGSPFKRPPAHPGVSSDDNTIDWVEEHGTLRVDPGDFVLATTHESVSIPDTLVAKVEGRSSLGRVGLSIHQTAGYIDPGFTGQITLEITNSGPRQIVLEPGDRICQIRFNRLSSPAGTPYGHDGSNYQHQTGPTESELSFE